MPNIPLSVRRILVVAITTILFGAIAMPASAEINDAAAAVDQVRSVIKCTAIDGEQFCTELGFIGLEPGSEEWRSYVTNALSDRDLGTGDMTLSAIVEELAAMPRSELAERQKRQIAEARAAVGKVKLIEYLADDAPIPEGFFAEYPGLKVAEGSDASRSLRAEAANGIAAPETTSASATYPRIPNYAYVMYGYAAEQEKSYWCGPAVMQMIDWADDNGKDSQALWANLMGTESSGATSISAIVSRINADTNWDLSAGTYSVVSVTYNTQSWFRSAHRSQIGAYSAPVVEHVKLLMQYFDYINYDHGGHFQVGRGYSYGGDVIAIIDPYDERDFRYGGAHSAGYHNVAVGKLWGATRANSLQNIGL